MRFLTKNWLSSLNYLLVSLGLVWIIYILYENNDQLLIQLKDVHLPGLLALLLLGSLYTLHSAFVFHLFLCHHTQLKLPFNSTARLLFTGQLIRHLPGRFWGVLFQVGETSDLISASKMIKVNIDLTAVTMLYATVAALVVISYTYVKWLSIPIILPILAITLLATRNKWMTALISHAIKILPKRIKRQLPSDDAAIKLSWSEAIKLALYYFSSFIFYYLGWKCFSLAWPAYHALDLSLLGAIYLLAWLIGFLSIATPSGLGVREAAFVLLTPSTSHPMIATIALLARTWFLLNDFIMFTIFRVLGNPLRAR